MKEEMKPAVAELLNDPNCTLTITVIGPIQNLANASNQNIQDAKNGIAQLTFSDIWRLPPFRRNVGSVDLQVRAVIAGGGRTWEVIIHDADGKYLIASTDVQGNVITAPTDERRDYVLQTVQNALTQSLQSGSSTDVNGPCK